MSTLRLHNFILKERKRNAEIRELMGLEPVKLIIKKGRLRWFRHVDRKDDTGSNAI